MSISYLVVAMAVFVVLHSLLARLVIKQWFKQRVGVRPYEAFYRLAYNVFAVLSFAPVAYVLVFTPSPQVWSLNGALVVVFRAFQVIGLLGLSISLLQIELTRFAGIRQVYAYMRSQPLPLPPEPLNTSGVYRWVRHPLYFFSLVVLWFTPSMSQTGLVFTITATLYFIFGSLLEERTMLKVFGAPYAQYQRQVAWMIPFLRW